MGHPASIGLVFNEDKSEILLIKRKDVPIWALPGGGIDKGETPEIACIREVEEETGYKTVINRPCAVYTPINQLSSTTYTFCCKINGGKGRLTPETQDFGFFPISALPKSLFFAHKIWIEEALENKSIICRPLHEINYSKFFYLCITQPIHMARYLYSKIKNISN